MKFLQTFGGGGGSARGGSARGGSVTTRRVVNAGRKKFGLGPVQGGRFPRTSKKQSDRRMREIARTPARLGAAKRRGFGAGARAR
jgi:hypothetical protein